MKFPLHHRQDARDLVARSHKLATCCWSLAQFVFRYIAASVLRQFMRMVCPDLVFILWWFFFFVFNFITVIWELLLYRIWTFSSYGLPVAILVYLFSCTGTNSSDFSFYIGPLISPSTSKGLTKLIWFVPRELFHFTEFSCFCRISYNILSGWKERSICSDVILCLFLVPVIHGEDLDLPEIFTEDSMSSGGKSKDIW